MKKTDQGVTKGEKQRCACGNPGPERCTSDVIGDGGDIGDDGDDGCGVGDDGEEVKKVNDWKVWQMVVLIGCCCMDPHFDTDHDNKKLSNFFLELMKFSL